MAFVAALSLGGGDTIEVFVDPAPREWRELEAAVDPVDGVRAYLVGNRLYAWLPAALHEEVAPLLRPLLAGTQDTDDWLPLAIVPALQLVNVTTSLAVGEEKRVAADRVERRIRRCPALRRRFREGLLVRHSWRLRQAA